MRSGAALTIAVPKLELGKERTSAAINQIMVAQASSLCYFKIAGKADHTQGGGTGKGFSDETF
jgi:hypothetical protein